MDLFEALVSTLLTEVISLTCPAAVLPRLLCSLTVQGAVHEGDGKKQEKVDNQRRNMLLLYLPAIIIINVQNDIMSIIIKLKDLLNM